MIAVHTSAIVAILWREKEQGRIRSSLNAANGAAISLGNLLELQLVLAGARSRVGWSAAESLLAEYAIVPCAFDERSSRWRERRRSALARGGTRRP